MSMDTTELREMFEAQNEIQILFPMSSRACLPRRESRSRRRSP